MSFEQKFQNTIEKLNTESSPDEFNRKLQKNKRSVFHNFISTIGDTPFPKALELKIESIIKSNSNPKQTAKLIMELVWVTRNEWK